MINMARVLSIRVEKLILVQSTLIVSAFMFTFARVRVFATLGCVAGIFEADASVQVPGEDVRGGNEKGSFGI